MWELWPFIRGVTSLTVAYDICVRSGNEARCQRRECELHLILRFKYEHFKGLD